MMSPIMHCFCNEGEDVLDAVELGKNVLVALEVGKTIPYLAKEIRNQKK